MYMPTKRFKNSKKRMRKTQKQKSSKKWVTAMEAAQNTLSKTGSYKAAKKKLRNQALINAQRLFGSI